MSVKNYQFFFIAILLAFISCEVKNEEPFTFVQLCDTQLGMGGYEHDVLNFKQAVKQINNLNPDFAVICGDLVHHATDSSYADFKRIMKGFKVPCYLASGNHDVGKIPTKSSLKYYREMIGKDFFTFQNKEYDFVVTNTQLWKVNVPGESENHHNWFKKTLDSLGGKEKRIFVIGHYPMYIKTPHEEDEYFNIPIEYRKEILNLLTRNNVKAYLSGHKHELVVNNYKNIQMVSGETTSKNFDNRPMGFRLWEVSKDTIRHNFVPLEN